MIALLIISHQYLVKGKRKQGIFVLRMMPQRLLLPVFLKNRMVMRWMIKHSNG
jgi:hypothetical protein